MADIRDLLNQIAAEETQLSKTQFFAPCVPGGQVRTKVAGIICTFTPQLQDFEGWGIFQPVDHKTARLVEEPSLPQIAEYLRLFKPLRLRLAYRLHGQTWLAYPVNEGDMQQRLGFVKPVPVHLVTEAATFEPVIVRWDVGTGWFDELDRRADPIIADQLREQLRQLTNTENLRFAGLTPEMRTVYDLALQQTEAFQLIRQQQQEAERQQEAQRQLRHQQREGRQRQNDQRLRLEAELQRQRQWHGLRDRRYPRQPETNVKCSSRRQPQNDETRLQDALQVGGGNLQNFRDRGDFWQIEWTTSTGEHHTSAISKDDLTVISSGICLSGYDQDFDLQSLVGVIERRDNWDF